MSTHTLDAMLDLLRQQRSPVGQSNQGPHAPPAPVPPPMGGPPALSSAIFARNGPQGGQGGGLPPEVIQMLLAQMMRGGR
jgi:hypothetical protein